ncbi:hypothetical protein BDV34DRAFT_226607 [Aspergillus parasiticus]|uniref:Uncharacterized protein n=1 Tax=Aspergillus parasiticus TaxID=5067 RepID=A0A5N6DGB9_ASPPA|nr:hypothetical protein BDV34DRAFT_226607 [Aspergillus parasiticus]
MNKIQRAINNIRKNTNKLTAKIEDSLQTFTSIAQGTPLPCYYQSNHNSASSAPTRLVDLDRDRTVTTEKHRHLAAVKTVQSTLISIQFVTAKILRLDNLQLFLRSAKEAEIAQTHQNV